MPDSQRATVLLVEDEKAVRAVMAKMLTRLGYRVLTAASGGDALARCAEAGGLVDLLLCDVVLPDLRGPELAARLLPELPDLAVLFVSGYGDEELRHRGSGPSLAGHAFLRKPFSVEALEKAVARALKEASGGTESAAGG